MSSLLDVSMFGTLIIAFALVFISATYFFAQWKTEIDPILATLPNTTATQYVAKIWSIWGWLDYVPLILYVTLLLGSLVSAYFSNSHPVFFIFFMIGLLLMTFYSWIQKEAFEEFVNANSSFLSAYNSYTYTKFFIENSPIITLVTGVLIATFQYSKIGERFDRVW